MTNTEKKNMQNKISEVFKCNCTSESEAYATGT